MASDQHICRPVGEPGHCFRRMAATEYAAAAVCLPAPYRIIDEYCLGYDGAYRESDCRLAVQSASSRAMTESRGLRSASCVQSANTIRLCLAQRHPQDQRPGYWSKKGLGRGKNHLRGAAAKAADFFLARRRCRSRHAQIPLAVSPPRGGNHAPKPYASGSFAPRLCHS